MPRLLDAAAIEREMKVVRQLFESDAFWIISCAPVEQTAPDAQAAFRSAFAEFLGKSGAKIVVITTNAQIAEIVRVQARRVGVALTVVADYKVATTIRKEYDAQRPKKP